MLEINNLGLLEYHTKYLRKKFKNKDIFLVGGVIRDMFLDIEKSPKDIDLTMAGKPDEIYKKLDKTWVSSRITEKFGTMTIIPNKSVKSKVIKSQKEDLKTWWPDGLKYELTPLRTEWWYEDFRHPWEINRSNDVLLDAQRRDFSINCIYYFHNYELSTKGKTKKNKWNLTGKMIDILSKNGRIYISNLELLILRDRELIWKVFDWGKLNKDELLESMKWLESSLKGDIRHIIIDPFRWIQDLANKKIKTCWPAENRFTEDALRIIRALRFVSVLNEKLKKKYKKTTNKWKENLGLFDFDRDTRDNIKKHGKLVKNVAKERIKDEFLKVFKYGNSFGFVSLLDESGLLPILFPALAKTKNVHQPVRYHPFDIYAHTLLTLYELEKINSDYLVKLAVLYHDVWKVEQFDKYKDWLTKEEIRWILAGPYNHRRSSPVVAKKEFWELGFSSKELSDISRYIEEHHTPWEILDADVEKREKKMRRLLSDKWFDRVNNLLDICIADRLWQYNPLQNSSDISDVYQLRSILKKLHKEEWQFTMKNMKINWVQIMEEFNIEAGKLVWELLEKSFLWVINDIKNRNNKAIILEYIRKYIKLKKIDLQK